MKLTILLGLFSLISAPAYAGAEVVEINLPEKRIVLGITQPDSSIYYFDQGIRLVTEKIREVLIKRSIPGNFFQQMAEDKELRGVSFQLGRHLIPEEIVPEPLRDLGIDLTHFVLPDEKLTPLEFEKSYDVAYPEGEEPVYQELSRLDFMKLVELYRITYELPFFDVIRRAVQQDSYYDFGATALSWSLTLLEVEICLFTGKAVLNFWKGLLGKGILGSKIFTSLASSLTYFLSFSFVTKVTDALVAREAKDLEALFDRMAVANYGTKGLDYLDENRMALVELQRHGALGEFVSNRHVSKFLLNPNNYYDLGKMLDNLGRVDPNLMQALKDQEEWAIDELVEMLSPPADKTELSNLRAVVEMGSSSPLWCELVLLAIESDDGLYVYTDDRGSMVTAHAASGEISLKEKDYFHPGRLASVLGHELWHRAKVSYRDAEIFRYFDKEEYSRAFAAEEVLGTLVESEVMKQIADARPGFKQNIVDVLERINPTKYDLVIDLYGVRTFQAQVTLLFQHFRSHHWDQWRDE